jgi:hypothetical protein
METRFISLPMDVAKNSGAVSQRRQITQTKRTAAHSFRVKSFNGNDRLILCVKRR